MFLPSPPTWSFCLWSLLFWISWQKGKFCIIDHALIMAVLECLSWERFTSLVLHFSGDKLLPVRSGDLLKDLWVGGRDRNITQVADPRLLLVCHWVKTFCTENKNKQTQWNTQTKNQKPSSDYLDHCLSKNSKGRNSQSPWVPISWAIYESI